MKKILTGLLLLFVLTIQAQQYDSTATPQNFRLRKGVIIGGLAIQQTVSFYVQYKWWWKNNFHSFRFENDGMVNNYTLAVDKLGHFYTSYLYFHSLNEIMRWGGFSQRSRMITSTVLPAAWALSIEIGDAFSKDYGFSVADLTANYLGLGYGLVQERYPYFRKFNFKMSYYPTTFYSHNNYEGWSLTSDYRGHFYWLSFDVHGLLPKPAQRYWPAFLNIAVGYGIDKNGPRHEQPKYRDWGISFDWNLSAFKTKKKGLHAAKEIINYVHFPAPGAHKVQGQATEYEWILLR
jgi:hypothetical protein